MNILIFNTWYYPNMKGGAEQSVKLLADGLACRGHHVAVITADGKDEEREYEAEQVGKVTVYRLAAHMFTDKNCIYTKVISKLRDIKWKRNTKRIEKIIEIEKPDIIHTNSMPGLSFYAWKIIAKRKIPLVHTLRDYSVCSPKGIYESSIFKLSPYGVFLRFYQKRIRMYSKDVKYVTSPSKFTLNRIMEDQFFPASESKIVVNAVELDLEETKRCIEVKKAKYNSMKKQRILFAGRLLDIKGIKLLIKAFALLRDDNLSLEVCGEGKLEDFVRESAERDKRINYLGMLDKEKLNQRYHEADVVIFPSLWDEPFGRIVIEANKFGTPVIASRKGGISEIMDVIGGGILFTPTDEKALAEIIADFLKSDFNQFYANILDNLENYSLQKQINDFEQTYMKLTGLRDEDKVS